MESIRAISSRLLNTEDAEETKQDISAADRQWVQQKCEELNEWNDRVMVFWIKKIKKEDYKRQKRIVVITDYRLMSVRKTSKSYDVRREGHLLDLVKVQEQGLILTISFKEFKVEFQCVNDTDSIQILHTLYHNYAMTDPGFPPKLQCEWLDQYNASQAQELSKKVPLRTNERGKWEKAVRAFQSYCSFYSSDATKLSAALQSILSRELFDKEDERWIRTSDMGITHTRVLAGLIISVTFTSITIDGIEVTDIKGDKYLYDAFTVLLRHNSSVRSLVLDGVATGPEWGDLLYEGLNQNQRSALIRFGLKNAKLGEKGMTSFINGNKKLARQPECLYLTKTGAAAKQMVQLISTFIGKSEYGSGLTELDLSDNPLESRGTQALAARLSSDFPDLKVLRLANCHIDIPRLLSAIEQAHKKNALSLEELDISGNKCTPQDGLILSRIVANCGTMASLGIAGCGFGGPIVAAVVAASLVNDQMKYYVQLEASDNDIGPEGAIMIASILRMTDRVMTLKMNNCDMGHEGMGYVIKSLENQPYLRTLELNNNCKREQWTVGKYRVAEGLKALLEKSSVLERLSLHNDPENGYQCDLDDFLVSLRTNATLISLDISGNSLTNENLQALKDVVLKNEVLQELRWDNNGVNSRHIVAMTHALKHNRSLQLVEFPDQDFERELAQAGKDQKRVMELQMVKKSFYQALFENKKLVGFEAAPLAMKRNMKKRHSLLPSEYKQREIQEKKPPPRGNQLMIPGSGDGD